MAPSPENQIKFLVNLQRLLAEGLFVATYEYALLLALADPSVEKGDDSGTALTISTRAIAEKFVAYYWRQSAPFVAGSGARVLQQNTGKQAKVVRVLEDARGRYGGTLAIATHQPSVDSQISWTIDKVVRVCRSGSSRRSSDRSGATSSTPTPGRALQSSCGRSSPTASLISDLVRGASLRNARQHNNESDRRNDRTERVNIL
jgi:hypothetical protein